MYNETLDYKLTDTLQQALDILSNQAQAIAGEWNGDESGELEDRANCAIEIIDLVAQLKDCLEELA